MALLCREEARVDNPNFLRRILVPNGEDGDTSAVEGPIRRPVGPLARPVGRTGSQVERPTRGRHHHLDVILVEVAPKEDIDVLVELRLDVRLFHIVEPLERVVEECDADIPLETSHRFLEAPPAHPELRVVVISLREEGAVDGQDAHLHPVDDDLLDGSARRIVRHRTNAVEVPVVPADEGALAALEVRKRLPRAEVLSGLVLRLQRPR